MIICLQVRFRQGQDLQDLSKGTQSGGEKSVSTAVYMMALQELTQVPFRCVDEINQGRKNIFPSDKLISFIL